VAGVATAADAAPVSQSSRRPPSRPLPYDEIPSEARGLSLLHAHQSPAVVNPAHTSRELDHDSLNWAEQRWHKACRGGNVTDPAEIEPADRICLSGRLFVLPCVPCRRKDGEPLEAVSGPVCAVGERERHTASLRIYRAPSPTQIGRRSAPSPLPSARPVRDCCACGSGRDWWPAVPCPVSALPSPRPVRNTRASCILLPALPLRRTHPLVPGSSSPSSLPLVRARWVAYSRTFKGALTQLKHNQRTSAVHAAQG